VTYCASACQLRTGNHQHATVSLTQQGPPVDGTGIGRDGQQPVLAAPRRPAGRARTAPALALATLLVLLTAGASPGQEQTTPSDTAAVGGEGQIRIFFVADFHSRHHRLDRFIEAANRERPDLVLEGGDMVHDGTEAELRRAFQDRGRLEPPWYGVPGNHDAELRGPFSAPPPELPRFQAIEHQGVRFILLDNHAGVLAEEQFQRLEAELESAAGRPVLVAMHVPPTLGRERTAARLRHLLPYRLASPTMHDEDQVARFTGLMERYGVLAVLAAHTHAPDRQVSAGVHYVVAGAGGGLTPGLGIAGEYLDITVQGRAVTVRSVTLGEPSRDPVTFVARAFRFFAHVNGFNHAEQGWNYTPSASVQLRAAVQRTETGGGENPAFLAAVSFERVLGGEGRQAWVADTGLSAGRRELAAHLAAGYKLRPIGTFNENLYLTVAAAGNAGMVDGGASAGIGARLGVGLEWRDITAEVARTRATNHRASVITFGRRF
jgi:predicted phosphodiesterase